MAPSFYESVTDFLDEVNHYASPISIIKGGVAALFGASTVAPHAIPGFEVKLSLSNTSLIGGVPCKGLRNAFHLEREWDERSYEYYDTDGKDLSAEGWAVRLRHKEDEDFEMTYKKRWRVTDGIHNALEQARAEGFDYGDKNYKAEIDWSYSKQTLSMQIKKRRSKKGYRHTDMPDDATGRAWLQEGIPGKLEHWKEHNWGNDILAQTRKHGPVTSTVWDGRWKGREIGIEILPVRGEDDHHQDIFAELSFKVKDMATAKKLREQMIEKLDKEGWLVHNDHLKTRVILDRY
ncbi:hypothetical protein A1Q2_04007 [Trichosporon asahii var. asahii CBS 8904]|uniref:CYTH domain-containing protein n=1 Tax=Trichosporon asahii var. asahii (strain CBS 8904) TaxID=1220162 RepID=K1VLR0_TRIAC|nr:hypothetical protein A1Q2_04007 [Trichosporon asahii var. asahii CBS 8904]